MKKTFYVSLVGMGYYSPPFDVRRRIHENSSECRLQREPSNPHDPNAIAVLIGSHIVGHLDRRSAATIVRPLQSGASYSIVPAETEIGAATVKVIKLKVTLTIDRTTKVVAPKPTSARAAGVYRIIAGSEGVYIGQANNINLRIAQHWKDLGVGCHANSPLQEAWSRYGGQTFSVCVLEHAPVGLSARGLQQWLGDREQQAIVELRRNGNCLNRTDGEIVDTKAALTEYRLERERRVNEHNTLARERNAFVRKRRPELKAQIEALEASGWPSARAGIRQLRQKRDELNSSILRNTGLRGFVFGTASKFEVQRWTRALEDVDAQIRSLEQKDAPFSAQLRALHDEMRQLKIVKLEKVTTNPSPPSAFKPRSKNTFG